MAENLNPITGLPEENKPKKPRLLSQSTTPQTQLSPMKDLLKPVDIAETIPEKAPSKEVRLLKRSDFTVDADYGKLMQQYDQNLMNERNDYLKKLDEDQAWYESSFNALTKLTGKTAARVGLGLLGTGWDLVKLVSGNNPLEKNIFQEWEESAVAAMDEALPIYSENPNYHNLGFMDKLFTEPGKMFGDEIGDAVSFMGSAILQEMILSAATAATFGAAAPLQASASLRLGKQAMSMAKKGFNTVPKLLKSKQAFKNFKYTDEIAKTFDQAGDIAKAKNLIHQGASVPGLAGLVHWEAGLEASGTYDAMIESYKDTYREKYGVDPTEGEIEQAAKVAEDARAATYAMNAGILLPSHLIQFGSAFKKMYGASKAMNKAASQIIREGGETMTKHAAKSKVNKLLTYTGLTLKNPITEAGEEFMQGVASEGNLEYFARQYSPDSHKNSLGYLASMANAGVEYFNSTEGGNSMGIGAIVGLLGLPLPKKMGGWSGGIVGDIREYNQTRKMAEQLIDKYKLNDGSLNTILQENYKNFVTMTSLGQDMEEASTKGDAFEFKNLEHDQLFSYIFNRVNLGLSEDIQDDIKSAQEMPLEQFNKEWVGESHKPLTEEERTEAIEKLTGFVQNVQKYSDAAENIIEYNSRRVKKDGELLRQLGNEIKPYIVHAASTLTNLDVREEELTRKLTDISTLSEEEVKMLTKESKHYQALGRLSALAKKEKAGKELTAKEKEEMAELRKVTKINAQALRDLYQNETADIDLAMLRSISGDMVDLDKGVDQEDFLKAAQARLEVAAENSKNKINKAEIMSTIEDLAKVKNRRESFGKYYEYLSTPEGIEALGKMAEKAKENIAEAIQHTREEGAREKAETATTPGEKKAAKDYAAEQSPKVADEIERKEERKVSDQAKTAPAFDGSTPGKAKSTIIERYKDRPELLEQEAQALKDIFKKYGQNIEDSVLNNPTQLAGLISKSMIPGKNAALEEEIKNFFNTVQSAAEEELKKEQEIPDSTPKDIPTEGKEDENDTTLYDSFELDVEPLKANVWQYAWNKVEKIFKRDKPTGKLIPADPLLKNNKIDFKFLNSGQLAEFRRNKGKVNLIVDMSELDTSISSKEDFKNNFKILITAKVNGEEKVLSLLPSYKPDEGISYVNSDKAKALKKVRDAIYANMVKDGLIDDASFSPNNFSSRYDTGYEASIESVGTGRIHIQGGLNNKVQDVLGPDFKLGVVRTTPEGTPYIDVPNNKGISVLEPSKDSMNPGNVYALIPSANGTYVAAHINTRDLTDTEKAQIETSLNNAVQVFADTLSQTESRAEAHKAFKQALEAISDTVYTKDLSVKDVKLNEDGTVKDAIIQFENPLTNEKTPRVLSDALSVINTRKSQVDINKINKVVDGAEYNLTIDGDKITTNVVVGDPIHSTTFNLNPPYEKSGGSILNDDVDAVEEVVETKPDVNTEIKTTKKEIADLESKKQKLEDDLEKTATTTSSKPKTTRYLRLPDDDSRFYNPEASDSKVDETFYELREDGTVDFTSNLSGKQIDKLLFQYDLSIGWVAQPINVLERGVHTDVIMVEKPVAKMDGDFVRVTKKGSFKFVTAQEKAEFEKGQTSKKYDTKIQSEIEAINSSIQSKKSKLIELEKQGDDMYVPGDLPFDSVDTKPSSGKKKIAKKKFKKDEGQGRTKLATSETRKWDKAKSLAWLKKNLPNVPVHILDDLQNIAETGGRTAWGLFKNASIYIAENAGIGTAYHEAFHAVFWLSLNEKQRFNLLQEAQSKTGLTDDVDLEEWIAEKFEEYVLSNTLDNSLGARIKNWFKNIWASIKGIVSNSLTIDELFDNINRGAYRRTKVTGPQVDILRTKLKDFSVNERFERVEMLSSMFVNKIGELEAENPGTNIATLINNAQYEAGEEGNTKVVRGPQAIFSEMYEMNLAHMFNALIDIRDNNLDWAKIEQLEDYDSEVYDNFKGDTADEINYKFKQYETLLEHFDEMGLPKAYNKEESLANEVLKDLRKYGIKINISTKEAKKDETVEEENYQDIAQDGAHTYEAWQYDRAEQSGKDTVSFYIKHELSKFIEHRYDKNGDLEEVKDSLGYYKRLEFATVFNALKHDLTGIYTVTEMLEELEQLVSAKPYYAQVIAKIKDNPRFRSAFLHAMATTQMNYVTAVQNRGRYEVIGSNRHTPELTIRKEWNANFVLSKRQGNINYDKLSEEQRKIKTFLDLKKKSGTANEIDGVLAVTISNYLSKIGIGLTPEEVTNNPLQTMAFFNRGSKFVLEAIKRDENPYSIMESGETSSLLPLIEMAVRTRNDLYESSFLNVEGKQIFSNQVPNFMHKAVKALLNKDNAYIKFLKKDPFYQKNKWLDELLKDENNRELFKVFVLDGISPQEEDSVKYSKMTGKQRFLTDLLFYYNTSPDGKEGSDALYSFPILADAPQLPFIRFKKYSKEDIVEFMMDIAVQEYDRNKDILKGIKAYENGDIRKSDLIENYHYKMVGGKMELNKSPKYQYITTMGNWNPTSSDANKKKTKDAIIEFLSAEVAKQKANAKAFNISKQDINQTIENFDTVIENYAYNQTFANIQALQLFSGDSAMYKSQVDLAKRNKQTSAPGSILDTTEIGETYKTIYLEDVVKGSEFLDIYKDILKNAPEQRRREILNGYTAQEEGGDAVDVADGQAVISLARAKDILVATGEWTANHDAAYPKLVEGVATEQEMSLFLQPFKPFYYGMTYSDTFNKMVPVQNKNSEFVVFPQMLNMPNLSKEGKARIQKMLDIFETGEIQSIQFESAVKVGKSKVYNFNDINANNMEQVRQDAHTLYNKDYNLQLSVPEHHMDEEVLLGVQIMKLAISNMDLNSLDKNYELNGEMYTAKELFDKYQGAITQNIEEEAKKLREVFKSVDDKGNTTDEKLARILKEEMMSRGMSKKYLDALELDGNKKFKYPLYFPLSASKNENVMSALFRNRVTRQKIKGGSFVQVSDFIFGEDLKVVTKEVNGETVIDYMEAMLPWWSKKYFPMDENGIVDLASIPEELTELIAYRIPTEAKYSMPTIKVVGFTPQTAGGVAVLPADITRRAGTDFDVDKLFIMMPEFKVNKNNTLDADAAEREYQKYVTTPNWSPTAGEDIVRSDIPKFDPLRARREFAKTKRYSWDAKEGVFKKYEKSIEKIPSGTATKKSRNNLILDIMRSILQNPIHQSENLKPGTFQTLKDLTSAKPEDTNSIIVKLGLQGEEINMALPSSQLELFRRNMAGKALIGMFANHSANHAITQYSSIILANPINLFLEDGTKYEGGLKDFNIQRDYKGGLISENLAQFLAAAVDNAKDPVLSMLNVNTHTADVVAMLVRMGMPIEDAINVINVPSIRSLVEKVENGTDYNVAFNLVREELLTKYKGMIAPINIYNTIDIRKIKGTVRNESQVKAKDKQKYADQLYKSLLLFNNLKSKSENLATLVSAARVDSLGSRTLGENQQLITKIQRAQDSKTFVKGTVSKLFNGVTDKEGNEITPSPYPMLKAFLNEGIKEATAMIGDYIPFQKGRFTEAKAKVVQTKGAELKISEDKLINNHILTYIASKFDIFNVSRQEAADMIRNFPEEFQNKVKKDKYLQDNKFIRAIFFDQELKLPPGAPASKKATINYDRLLTNNASRLEESQREKIELAFEELIRNPEYETFALEIMQYGFLANGFSFGPKNFLSTMPISIFESIVDANGKTLMQHFKDNIANFNVEDFLKKFIPNTFESHNIVKTFKLNDTINDAGQTTDFGLFSIAKEYYTTYGKNNRSGVLTSFIVGSGKLDTKNEEVSPDFIRIFDPNSKVYRLYHKIDSTEATDLYVLAPKSSEKNVYVQYTSDAGMDYAYDVSVLSPLQLFAQDERGRFINVAKTRYKGADFLSALDVGGKFIHTKDDNQNFEEQVKDKKGMEDTKKSIPPTVVTVQTPEEKLDKEITQEEEDAALNETLDETSNQEESYDEDDTQLSDEELWNMYVQESKGIAQKDTEGFKKFVTQPSTQPTVQPIGEVKGKQEAPKRDIDTQIADLEGLKFVLDIFLIRTRKANMMLFQIKSPLNKNAPGVSKQDLDQEMAKYEYLGLFSTPRATNITNGKKVKTVEYQWRGKDASREEILDQIDDIIEKLKNSKPPSDPTLNEDDLDELPGCIK